MRRYLLSLALLLTAAPRLAAEAAEATHLLPYSGRLLDEQGQAVQGPVEIKVAFFGSEEGDDVLTAAPPLTFPETSLSDGVFHVTLALTGSEVQALFRSAGAVYLQVKDATHDRVYRRQRFTPPASVLTSKAAPAPASGPVVMGVPAPLLAAVDPQAPVPTATGSSTATSEDAGAAPVPTRSTPREQMVTAAGAACLASPVAGAKFLAATKEALTCSAVCSAARDAATCIRGWTLFAAGDLSFDFGNECTSTETPPGIAVESRLCCCLSTLGPMPIIVQDAGPAARETTGTGTATAH